MGQKSNPLVQRLGSVKNWENQYINKKTSETAEYDFKNIEIKKMCYKFFKDHNLLIHNFKLLYNENIAHIYISYCSIKKTFYTVRNENPFFHDIEYTIPKRSIKNFASLKQFINNLFYYKKIKQYIKLKSLKVNENNIDHQKKPLRKYSLLFKKETEAILNENSLYNISNKAFLNGLLENLTQYIGKNKTVILTIKQINKNLRTKISRQKIMLVKDMLAQLRLYKDENFFNDSINLFFQSLQIKTNKSADILANFIALKLSELSKSKRKNHNFFFRFLETILNWLTHNIVLEIKGIKIEVRGRINKARRTKLRRIIINKPVNTISLFTNTDYSEAYAFTKNGSLGVKVWIEK